MTQSAGPLASDLYRFIGIDIAVSSNAPPVLESLRVAYGRFLQRAGAANATPPGTTMLRIVQDESDARQFRLEDGEWRYSVLDEHGEAQFERFPVDSTEPDLTGFADLPTVLRAALLERLGHLLRPTPFRLFHSGAVTYNGRALLFPATSGMGKTTLVVKLLERGCRLLSDELACIDTRTGCVVPFARRINVRENSMPLLRLREEAALDTRLGYTGEREWTFDAEDIGFSYESRACPPSAALFLRGFGNEASVAPLSSARALFDFVPFHIGDDVHIGRLLCEMAPFFERLCCRSLIVGTPDETADLALALACELEATEAYTAAK